jgi:hypothetical protein
MKNIYKYKIIKDAGLVIQYHRNDLTYEDAKKLKIKILNDVDFSPDFSFLIDVREARSKVTNESTKNYGDFVSDNLVSKGLKKIAILTDTPEQVANATIFALEQGYVSSQYKIFSTLKGAARWLNIDKLEFIYYELNRMAND